MDGEDRFIVQIARLHAAEMQADEALMLQILARLPFEAAPDAWKSPFADCCFCKNDLLCKSPAIFWRRLSKRFPRLRAALGSAVAALCEEDLLDLEEPATVRVDLLPGLAIALREGSYSTGGIGRHLYAAATALATVLARGDDLVSWAPSLAGKRVLELGCGLGLVGLAAAQCGAPSVLMTDYADASVQCAAANAALNGLGPASGVRSARLDWEHFATADSAEAACEAAGLGARTSEEADEWWPDLILAGARSCRPQTRRPQRKRGGPMDYLQHAHNTLNTHNPLACPLYVCCAADVCYSDAMGDALIQALSHILQASPRSTRAIVLNGWPNRGLARLESFIGARTMLADQAQAALEAGEPAPPHRPFVDDDATSADAPLPRGLETLQLVAAERLTGFAEHPHHMYAIQAK